MSRHWVTTQDDVRIAAYDLGGDGPPLLFAHATGFHALVWKPLAALLQPGYHCYALDHRGHGDSGRRSDGDFSWSGMVLDVQAVIAGLGLGLIHGIGHSLGGGVLLMAELARPGTMRSLWTFEPVVFPPAPETPYAPTGNALADGARRRRRTFASRQAALDNFTSKPPLSVLTPDALAAYVDHGFRTNEDGSLSIKCDPEDEAAVFEAGGRQDTFTHLSEVACPVTIAQGAPSASGPEAWAPAIAQRLRNGQLDAFAGLSHFGPLQHPEALVDSIRRTLQRAGSSGG